MNWCAYSVKDYLFVKKFKYEVNQIYPDYYSNIEVYTCNDFLELETLSPLKEIKQNEELKYNEIWEFHKNRQIDFGAKEISFNII